MYKDNGTVDVEFLAEVGYIAHRVRKLDKNLEQKISALGPNPLDANTAHIHCTNATAATTSATVVSQCDHKSVKFDKTSSDLKKTSEVKANFSPPSTSTQATNKFENIIIALYEKHQEYHIDKERVTVEKYYREKSPSKLYHLTNGKDTMNSGSTNQDHPHQQQNVSEPGTLSLLEEVDGNNETTIDSKSNDSNVSPSKRIANARGSISQPTPEIQISNSDGSTTTAASSIIIDQAKEPLSPGNPLYTGGSGAGSCGHYCGGWQTSICTDQLNDEDLRALVFELKRKVEFTERMNWLLNVSGLSKRPAGLPHRKTSLPKHTEVKKRFLEICDRTLSEEIKSALRLPAFDSYEWEDEDVLHLMQTMFTDMGLVEKFGIPISTLREWLYEVYKHYNAVPFHNFRHCFCVAQMMYAIAWQTNLSARLGDLEVLILLVSCICHDLDHPGYNNIYQINARTELALRYNDISPLENHHCSIAFRLLEHPDCNIFKNFNKDTFKEIREGIIRCILATDMARHNEILTQFQEISPVFDYSNEAHINLLCMVLIKVADISNEARPMDIAEPW